MCCVFLRHFRCVSSVGLAALPIQLLGFQRMSFKSMLKQWSFRISVADGKRTLPRSRTRRPHVFRCNITSAIQNSKSTEKVLVPKKYKSTIEAEDNESISGPPVEV